MDALSFLVAAIAIKVWMANSIQLGALEALVPAGFAIGAMTIMAYAKKVTRRGAWMMGGIAAAGALISATALIPTAYAAMPVTLLCGIGLALGNVLLQLSRSRRGFAPTTKAHYAQRRPARPAGRCIYAKRKIE